MPTKLTVSEDVGRDLYAYAPIGRGFKRVDELICDVIIGEHQRHEHDAVFGGRDGFDGFLDVISSNQQFW